MTPKTDQQTTAPVKAGWVRPQLTRLGTIKDVAGPFAGISQNGHKS